LVVRIKDIARDLGVSSMTVSKALRNQFDISEATRKRVIKRAEELGYQPNLVARGLVTRRTYMIGMVIPDLMDSFFAEVVKGAAKRIKSHGYQVVIQDSEGDANAEMGQIETLLAHSIDGLIVASAQSNGRWLHRTLGKSKIPCVLIKDLEQVTYKADSNAIDKDRDRMRTHLSDALGYLLWQECRMLPRIGERRERLF